MQSRTSIWFHDWLNESQLLIKFERDTSLGSSYTRCYRSDKHDHFIISNSPAFDGCNQTLQMNQTKPLPISKVLCCSIFWYRKTQFWVPRHQVINVSLLVFLFWGSFWHTATYEMKVKNSHSIIFSKNKNLGWTTELLNKFHNNSGTLQEHFQEIPQQLATLKSYVWIFTHNPVIFHPPPMGYPGFFWKFTYTPSPKIKINLKCS